MRRFPMVCVLVLLLTGCSPEDEYVDPLPLMTPTWRPTPTPAPTTFPKLPAKGDLRAVRVGKPRRPLLTSDFTFANDDIAPTTSGQILEHLKRATQYIAGYPAKTTARCAGGQVRLAAGATTNCTVYYQGRAVKWTVFVAGTDPSVKYDVHPLQGILLREAVYAAWYKEDPAGRCDEIPVIQVVALDSPTTYRCQYLVPQDNTGPTAVAPYWSDSEPIELTEYGINFAN